MSAPDSLKDVYLDEMTELWSANDPMARALCTRGDQASDPELRQRLQDSGDGLLRDIQIIAQYPRMSYDGPAGFGAAAADARALGRSDPEVTRKGAVAAIDEADADASPLAESVEPAAA
ncbi:hypothetical protein [Methylobacterium sp. Leaf118]|uniref:hypothetical protein n=1 Tax=Methylobacterium sp. Leaf118 TaxID=2876562 RepID=UPI001E50577B|nr:hypothetical protein [Methylobacterium sp. Leaf118]